jgi:hypothetical protein
VHNRIISLCTAEDRTFNGAHHQEKSVPQMRGRHMATYLFAYFPWQFLEQHVERLPRSVAEAWQELFPFHQIPIIPVGST